MSVETLFAVPRELRDSGWAESLLYVVPKAPMAEAGPLMGPDGFGYLALRPGGDTSVEGVLDACLDQGLGVVLLDGRDPRPQWAFPFGNLWSYKEHATFALPEEPAGEPTGQVLVGSPTDDLLPPYARAALRKELQAQGASAPGVLVVDAPGMSPSRSLTFDPMPDPQRLLWYLPPHLGLVSMNDGWPDPLPL